jgi:hypothetical protein
MTACATRQATTRPRVVRRGGWWQQSRPSRASTGRVSIGRPAEYCWSTTEDPPAAGRMCHRCGRGPRERRGTGRELCRRGASTRRRRSSPPVSAAAPRGHGGRWARVSAVAVTVVMGAPDGGRGLEHPFDTVVPRAGDKIPTRSNWCLNLVGNCRYRALSARNASSGRPHRKKHLGGIHDNRKVK